MKKALHEFFRLSDDEFNSLWRDGLISFDSNALLNLYRFSPKSRDAMVELIKAYSDRIRLPHQFALEYARNRPKVIVRQVKCYSDAQRDLSSFERDRIRSKRQHPHLSEDTYRALGRVSEELIGKRKELESLLSNDPYAEFLLTTCAGKIGEAPDGNRLNELYNNGRERYARKVPPGYEDQDKAIPDCYGDYVAWEQLISLSSNEKKDVILITDDFKEDWWWIESGRTVGPRPELLSEFLSRSGQRTWLYSSEGFLRAAQKYVGATVPESLLDELRQRAEEDREHQLEDQNKPKEIETSLPDKDKKEAPPTADSPANGLEADKTREQPKLDSLAKETNNARIISKSEEA